MRNNQIWPLFLVELPFSCSRRMVPAKKNIQSPRDQLRGRVVKVRTRLTPFYSILIPECLLADLAHRERASLGLYASLRDLEILQ
jgi:hypothetical protein